MTDTIQPAPGARPGPYDDEIAVAEARHDPFDVQALVDDAIERGEDPLQAVVFTALGAASACWDNLRGAGTFESDRCKEIGDALVAWLRSSSAADLTEREADANALEGYRAGAATGVAVVEELLEAPAAGVCPTCGAPQPDPDHCPASTAWQGPNSAKDHVHRCTKDRHRPNARHECECGASWLTREVG